VIAEIRHTCTPRTKRANYEAEDISIKIQIPFVPVPGSMIKVTPHGEFLEVDQIYWAIDSPDEVQIWIKEEEDLMPWSVMKAEGWAVATAVTPAKD
jgi:hypothetical protein